MCIVDYYIIIYMLYIYMCFIMITVIMYDDMKTCIDLSGLARALMLFASLFFCILFRCIVVVPSQMHAGSFMSMRVFRCVFLMCLISAKKKIEKK